MKFRRFRTVVFGQAIVICFAASVYAEISTVTLTGTSDTGHQVSVAFTEIGCDPNDVVCWTATSDQPREHDPAANESAKDVRDGLIDAAGNSVMAGPDGSEITVTVKRVTVNGKPGFKASSTSDFQCWAKDKDSGGGDWMLLEPGVDVEKDGITFRKSVPLATISVHDISPLGIIGVVDGGPAVDLGVLVDFDEAIVDPGLLIVGLDFQLDGLPTGDLDITFLDTAPLAAGGFTCTGTPPNCTGTCPDVPDWTNAGCVTSKVDATKCVWRYTTVIRRALPSFPTEGTICSLIVDPDGDVDETEIGAESNNQKDIVFGQSDHIPAVSEWGMIVMILLALTAGTVVFARWRRPAAA